MALNPFLQNKNISTPMNDKVSRTPSPTISPMHDPRQKKAVVQPPNKVLGAVNREFTRVSLGMVTINEELEPHR
jgi:hypothetical protein